MGRKKAAKAQEPSPVAATPDQPTDALHLTPGAATGSELDSEISKYPEIQQNEYLATQAIYPDEFERVHGRRDAWKVSTTSQLGTRLTTAQNEENLAFRVRLTSFENPDFYVRLEFEFSQQYPKVPLKVKLIDFEPDLLKIRNQIDTTIEAVVQTHLGGECVHEVTGAIDELLNRNALSRAEKANPFSLEEERATRTAAAQLAEQRKQLDQKRQQEAAEVEARRDLTQRLESERHRRENSSRNDSSTKDMELVHSPFRLTFRRELACKNDIGQTIKFSTVEGLSKELRRDDKVNRIVSPLPLTQNDGELPKLFLKEIILKKDLEDDEEQMRRTIIKIEGLLQDLCRHKHQHVVDVIGYTIIFPGQETTSYEASKARDPDSYYLFVLSEYIRHNLTETLLASGHFTMTQTRKYVRQIVQGLEYLDKQKFEHPAIHSGNVLLQANKDQDNNLLSMSVKISDGYGTALRELVDKARGKLPADGPNDLFWNPPEVAIHAKSRTAISAIWDLGVVAVQMALGIESVKKYDSPIVLFASGAVSGPFAGFLKKALNSEPRERPNAYTLITDAFFFESENEGPENDAPRLAEGYKNRFLDDFQVLDHKLGKGGFGKVVSALKYADQTTYAIKTIKVRKESALELTRREVINLANLQHPFVVRYFDAWADVETTEVEGPDDLTSQEESAVQSFLADAKSGRFWNPFPGSDDDDDNDDDDNDDDNDENAVRRRPRRREFESATIYIQMEFCDGKTLSERIADNLYMDVDQVLRLMHQILDAVAYIHGKGIAHRDLKPLNIFFGSNNVPRIGDFGLATVAAFAEDGEQVGTPLYMAPELRKQKTVTDYTKADMYSLGIIFYEMNTVPTHSASERISIIRHLHTHGKVVNGAQIDALDSEWFDKQSYQKQGAMIRRLIVQNPQARPAASELLHGKDLGQLVDDSELLRVVQAMSLDDRVTIGSNLIRGENSDVQDLSWDHEPTAAEIRSPLLNEFVSRRLKIAFKKNGAVEGTRQPLIPKGKHTGSDTVIAMESSLLRLQLEQDLTTPFARSIANTRPSFSKSYCIGTYFEARGQAMEPKQQPEASFDFVSYKETDLALKEASTIYVLQDIIAQLPQLQLSQFVLAINHMDLLDLILDYCRVKPADRLAVKKVLSHVPLKKLSVKRSREFKIGLQNHLTSELQLSETTVDDLTRFLGIHGTAREVGKALAERLGKDSAKLRRAQGLITRLEETMGCLSRLGFGLDMIVAPLSNAQAHLYEGGITFLCMEQTRGLVVAVGGRYDNLVKAHQRPSSQVSSPVRAVGVRVVTDSLLSVITAEDGAVKKTPVLSRVDVLVTSFDSGLLTTRCLDVLRLVLGAGLAAELTEEVDTMGQLEELHAADGPYWLVIVRAAASEVKVRSPSGDERTVAEKEAGDFLRVEVARAKKEGRK
jgi:eukaryotic translation initiation factor 2-alpha kinase 4